MCDDGYKQYKELVKHNIKDKYKWINVNHNLWDPFNKNNICIDGIFNEIVNVSLTCIIVNEQLKVKLSYLSKT